MASSMEELTKDITELKKFLGLSERKTVKDLLQVRLTEVEAQLVKQQKEAASKSQAEGGSEAEAPKPSPPKPRVYTVNVTNYAWDQSDKFLKIYMTDMKGVQGLPKDSIKSEFSARYCKLTVQGLGGKNYKLAVGPLHEDVSPSASYHKVKTDMVLMMLKKETEKKTWPYVTRKSAGDDDAKSPKAETKEDDPSAGLMNMLHKMYADGDDEMKRTIQKSWFESRQKSPMGDVGDL